MTRRTQTIKKYYLKIGNAKDLKNPKERAIYRAFEILPGTLAWVTLLGVIFLSWLLPVWIAFFIIAFDIYWLAKTIYLSLHLRSSFNRMRKHLKIDWLNKLKTTKVRNNRLKETVKGWQDIYHLVFLPTYKEGLDVLRPTFQALVNSTYPKDKMIVVLATEERAGKEGQKKAGIIKKEFGQKFHRLLITVHPQDIVGEIAGKGSNETWAARQVKKKIIDKEKIPYQNIITSVFDVDTRVFPDYFACLTYYYLTASKPTRASFQPIPIFNNNIWETPAPSRVVATSATFWQMMQQERPERLATFSSHSMSFKALVEMDYWQTNIVSEDSRIFWKSLLYYDGDYRVVPLFYPVSMDACLADNFFKTAANQYKQQRRWGWGVENIPYLFFGFLKNKKIALKKKLYHGFNHLEGFHSWATNALIIFLLGWLPLFLGGERFNITVLSYNLPHITRTIMTLAMCGLVTSAIVSTLLLPPRPKKYGWNKNLTMIIQWILLPLTILVFGTFPGLEAQTRLLLGKYMGFWVTEKSYDRRSKLEKAPIVNSLIH